MAETETNDGARFGGLKILKFTSTSGKNDKPGKVTVVLEADKDEINPGDYTYGSFLAAMDVHQTAETPIVIKLQMPTAGPVN